MGTGGCFMSIYGGMICDDTRWMGRQRDRTACLPMFYDRLIGKP